MPRASTVPLIAECDTCGALFLGGRITDEGLTLGLGEVYEGRPFSMRGKQGEPMVIGGDSPGVTSWSGVTLSCPCPGCEGWGSIPDGAVNWLTGAVTFLRSLPRERLVQLTDVIRAHLDGVATEEETLEAASEDAQPWLRQAIEKHHLRFIYQILLLILAITGGQSGLAHDVSAADRLLHKAVEKLLDETPPPSRPPPSRARPPETAIKRPEKLPHLNDPCWCGSGRRYRRCHRLEDVRLRQEQR